MLIEQTFEKLAELRMHGFARALQEQLESDDYDELGFDERVGMLVDREHTDREQRRLTRRLQQAKLREKACIEDIDYRHPRGLDKKTIRRLATCQWIEKHQNVVLTGPTGSGKTYISCALADRACREGHTALYRRLPRLLHELTVARGDGSYTKLLARIAKTSLLVIDDWGIAPLSDPARRDVLEVIEDRHGARSTIIATQLPISKWHAYIGDPTVADAVCDRLVHNAHQIQLKGGSMRKTRSNLANKEDSGR